MTKIAQIQTILGVTPDGIWGPKSEAALKAASRGDSTNILRGDGTWPWHAEIDGEDIVVRDARATCFGGSNDPQDSGETASGISTKKDPSIKACSLPMDYRGKHAPTRKALEGSPLPQVPWKTAVRIQAKGITLNVPVIDRGPSKYTGNAIDLTVAAARVFDPKATATRFEMRCDFRIIGGAKFIGKHG